MRSPLNDVVASEYVLLTTLRRSGVPVGTPVWIAPDGEEALVTTGATSGKVKRLRHTDRVTLQPCDVRGRVLGGSEPVSATATVESTASARARVDRALSAKYGLKYRMLRLAGRLRRSSENDSVVLVIR